MRKITIKDVARHAGVSIAAVSYVLNGKESKVSEETIGKINEAIKDLNYVPSMSARSLVNNDSRLIGIIIPQTESQNRLVLENPFYSEMISNVELVLREHGYHILLTGVDQDKTYLDVTISRNLDGAIIMGIYPEKLYEECKKSGIPTVLIDSYIHDSHFANVGIDDELGGYMATRYLIEQGHRHIALVTGMIRKDGVVEKRFLGYKKAIMEAGLYYNPKYVFEQSVSYAHGMEAGRTIATGGSEITAVFATADMMAFGLIRGLQEAGKQVPTDFSVIGFDDIPMSRMFLPSLTTIRQNIAMKGVKAAELLLAQLEGREYDEDPASGNIPLALIERQTVRKLNA